MIQVQEFIDGLRKLKAHPDAQISVAGIFGWPLPGEEAQAQYQIGKDPHPEFDSMKDLWTYLPICQSDALGKAYGGLRLKQFVDGFHGQTFSICQGNLGPALASLGAAIAQRACLPAG